MKVPLLASLSVCPALSLLVKTKSSVEVSLHSHSGSWQISKLPPLRDTYCEKEFSKSVSLSVLFLFSMLHFIWTCILTHCSHPAYIWISAPFNLYILSLDPQAVKRTINHSICRHVWNSSLVFRLPFFLKVLLPYNIRHPCVFYKNIEQKLKRSMNQSIFGQKISCTQADPFLK